jgi:SAM-dependent methyltransferase
VKAKAYWEDRFSDELSLATAGYRGLGLAYNKWLYRARRRALDKAIRALNLDVRDKRILDLGSGSGFYVDYWLNRGAATVTGVDITETSVSKLHERYPESRFVCADIASEAVGALGSFEIISAFDIFFHIVDQDTFNRAWSNMARCAAEGSLVLVTDGMTHKDMPMSAQEYHRSYDHYRAMAESKGLQIVYLAPVFYAMHNAVDVREANLLTRSVWWVTFRALRASRRLHLNSFIGNLLGMTLYTLDDLLLRLFRSGPTMKLMVLRRGRV